jgi:hypothetical protein
VRGDDLNRIANMFATSGQQWIQRAQTRWMRNKQPWTRYRPHWSRRDEQSIPGAI